MDAERSHLFLFLFVMALLFFAGVQVGASPLLLGLVISLWSLTLFLERGVGPFGSKEKIGDFFWGLSILPRGFLLAAAFVAPVFGALLFVFDVSPESALIILAYPFVWLGVSFSIGLWSNLGDARDSDKGRPYSPGKRP